jgi:ferric-chelate reductase
MLFPPSYQLSPTIDGDSSQLLASSVTATTSESSTVNASKLVFNGDVLLLAVFFGFVLLSLRRAFARFSCVPEWLQGHTLWSTSPDKWRDRRPFAEDKGINKKKSKRSQAPHSDMRHLEDRRRPSTTDTCVPPHAPAISSVLHPIASPLARRIMPGFSVGQAVILGVYGAILQYESFYKSNIFTDPIRTGFVGTAQIPFVFAFATKNNFMGALVGMGYEKVIHPSDRFVSVVRWGDPI